MHSLYCAALLLLLLPPRPDSLNRAVLLPGGPAWSLFSSNDCKAPFLTWRLAGMPTRRSPSFVKATIEGVVR
jgi:hypothetical protein